MPANEKYLILMNKATNGLKSAIGLANMSPPQVYNACYHCQQAVEKLLKAFMAFNQVRFRYIHNLDYLVKDCMNIDASFQELMNHCTIINHYSSDVRYVDYYTITESEMHEAIQLTEEVFNFVSEKTQEGKI